MPDIIQITLTDDQRRALAPLLDAARQATGIEGVLCSLSRAYCNRRGGSVLELQLMCCDRPLAQKAMRLLASSKTNEQ